MKQFETPDFEFIEIAAQDILTDSYCVHYDETTPVCLMENN